MAGHNKVYGICENKCMVEVLPKTEAATKDELEAAGVNVNQLLDYINIEIDYSWKSGPDTETNIFINNIKHSSNECVDVEVGSNDGYLTFKNKSSFAPKNKMFTVVGQFKNYSDSLDSLNYSINIAPQNYGIPTSGDGTFNLSVAVFGKPSDFVPKA